MDQEPEMAAFGRRRADALGLTNIVWVTASAESVALDGAFDLVTIGNAFHRLDREVVARRLVPHLSPRGGIALLWSEPPWRGDLPWQRALHDAIERWRDAIGVRDRVPPDWARIIARDPHERVLQRAGLTYEGPYEFRVLVPWTVESLVGFVHSTSFLSRAALGPHADAFERDLRRQLVDDGSDGGSEGVFEQEMSFTYELARMPAT